MSVNTAKIENPTSRNAIVTTIGGAQAWPQVVMPTRRDLFYDGRWQQAKSGRTMEIYSPGTQESLGHIADANAEDVDAAVRAEYASYLKYALPSPTPSSVTSPSSPMTQLTSPEEGRPVTGTARGAIITKGTDGHSYNIRGANLKLNGTAQLIEMSSNDQGEYEFANLSAGEYTLEVSAQGFKNVSKVVVVRTGETLIENITLEVADIQESVTVKSAIEGVQTTEAATS
jgi:hypothetical protein